VALADALGHRIMVTRVDRRLTQAELARDSGVDAAWLGQIERGEGLPSVAILLRLAEGLGVEPAVLLEGMLDHLERRAD